jgi:hypothetical protein
MASIAGSRSARRSRRRRRGPAASAADREAWVCGQLRRSGRRVGRRSGRSSPPRPAPGVRRRPKPAANRCRDRLGWDCTSTEPVRPTGPAPPPGRRDRSRGESPPGPASARRSRSRRSARSAGGRRSARDDRLDHPGRRLHPARQGLARSARVAALWVFRAVVGTLPARIATTTASKSSAWRCGCPSASSRACGTRDRRR